MKKENKQQNKSTNKQKKKKTEKLSTKDWEDIMGLNRDV